MILDIKVEPALGSDELKKICLSIILELFFSF